MNVIARILSFAAKHMGNRDGKLTLSDIPLAFSQLETMRREGEQLIALAADTIKSLKALASSGSLVDSDGRLLTAADIRAAQDAAMADIHRAVANIKADIGTDA